MSIDLLFADFDRLIQSSESVHRLRRFILDLAVRGKLAPQDPKQEPASELLKRIAAEKARLVKAGEIRTGKILDELTDPDKTFTVPEGWCWARLGNIATYLQRGKSPKYATGTDLLVVSQKCVKWNGLDLSVAKEIEAASLERYEGHRFLRDGDLLWNSTGTGTIGRIIRVESPPEKLVCDSHVTLIRCPHVVSEYLRTWLRSDHVYGVIESRAAGSTKQVELTTGLALNWQVPLPPLAEQHRIVAKVNELMALCDRLEAARAEREATRDRLATASLARLNAPDQETFQHDVAFALNNLAPLTTRPDQIKALRQTILNLAVRGTLVPQDPNDEPASELLKRIAAEKARLAKSGTIRKRKTSEPAPPDSLAFELPSGWAAAKLSDVLTELQTGPFGSSLHQNDYEIGGTPVINPASMRDGEIVPVEKMAVGPDTLQRLATFKLQVGDIVMGRRGEMGRCAVVTEQENGWLCGTGSLILRLPQCLYPEYLAMLIGSPYVREYLGGFAVGATMQNLNQSILLKMSIGLPPLAEQHRMVAKVNELMVLCDRLEASLSAGDHNRGRLAGALLYDGLKAAPDGKVAT